MEVIGRGGPQTFARYITYNVHIANEVATFP